MDGGGAHGVRGCRRPRLAVGVYATSASTPLYFAQAIGRFVRSRRPGETASVFLPSVPVLLRLASELEAQRDHVLGKPHREKEGFDDELIAAANKQEDEPGDDDPAFISLHADAELDQVIFDGSSFGTATFAGSDEESGLPGVAGLLNADQVRDLLRTRQTEQVAARSASAEARPPPVPMRRPPATDGAAQGTQQPGGDAPPSDGQATRRRPQRVAVEARWPAHGHGDGRSAPGADQRTAAVALTETTMAVTVPSTITATDGFRGVCASDEFLRVGGHRRAEIGETRLVLVVVVTAEQELAPGGSTARTRAAALHRSQRSAAVRGIEIVGVVDDV